MAWYDLNNLEKKEETTGKKDLSLREYKAKIKYEKIILERTKNLVAIIEDDLQKNVQYRFVTENAFNAIVVIEYLIARYELEEILMAVYRMNLQSVERLKAIIDNQNIKAKIILSSFFRENKRYEKWCEELMLYAEQKENVAIVFANNHAKVFLTKTKDGKHIVFEGSGNLSDNARIEQYLLEDNETTYNFHKKWISELKGKKYK